MTIPSGDTLSPTEARVLLVEDDDGTRMLLTRVLREAGYGVVGCRNGTELWQLLPAAGVDLILLDVMLPGASGLDLLRALRAKTSVPVIMVSARNDEADRVLGLELGADDYVAKPFGRPELLARIRAVLRRTSHTPLPGQESVEVLTFSAWRLDLRTRALSDPDGVAVDLSGAEFDLLLTFLAHPGRVLGREQILELSRARLGSPSDRSVDVLVSRLRRKLEPPDVTEPVIKTVRGVGYMLACKVLQA